MRTLREGLWHWQAPHPEWSAGEPWPREVSSYALDDGDRLLLFDPLAVPDELLALEREPVIVLTAPWHEQVHWYAPGDRLPLGIDAFAGREHNDLVLWLPSAGAVVAGDTLVDFGTGLALNPWLRGDATRQAVTERLRPLLDLPVEIVCPAHGAPTDRAALERALAL